MIGTVCGYLKRKTRSTSKQNEMRCDLNVSVLIDMCGFMVLMDSFAGMSLRCHHREWKREQPGWLETCKMMACVLAEGAESRKRSGGDGSGKAWGKSGVRVRMCESWLLPGAGGGGSI